jgi:hypothetical protein
MCTDFNAGGLEERLVELVRFYFQGIAFDVGSFIPFLRRYILQFNQVGRKVYNSLCAGAK